MENYKLESNEVLLYRGSCAEGQLLLTNLYLILIQSEDSDSQIASYPVSDIKIYRDIPQIFQKNRSVEIFLTTGEMILEFKTWLEAGRFTDAALELLTGKSKLARNAGKVKKALDDVNDAFGVNVLEEAKNFSVDAVSRIVSETKPSITKLLPGKKKNKNKPVKEK